MDWYVVNTKPNCEVVAKHNLIRQGYKTFLPSYFRTVRHARKTRDVKAPLFPTYIFVQFDSDWTPWRPINGTIGVRSILTGGDGRPCAVPDQVMAAMIERCTGEMIEWRSSDLTVGRKVRVTTGPFANFLGEVQRADSAGRVRLLLEAMGSISISAPVAAVQPLN
jgi:transcriptional antiterminator RfaH